MKESWIDMLTDKGIRKFAKKMCPRANNIEIEEFIGEDEKRMIIVNLDNMCYNGMIDKIEIIISELGFIISGDKIQRETTDFIISEELFKILRRENAGKTIDGRTYEKWFVQDVSRRIEEKHRKMIQEAKNIKNFEERYNKFYAAEEYHNESIQKLASFILKNNIQTESEPGC